MALLKNVVGKRFAEDAEVVAGLHAPTGAGMPSCRLCTASRYVEEMLVGVLVVFSDVHHVARMEVEHFGHMGGEVDAAVGMECDVSSSRGGDDGVCHRLVLHLKVTVVI